MIVTFVFFQFFLFFVSFWAIRCVLVDGQWLVCLLVDWNKKKRKISFSVFVVPDNFHNFVAKKQTGGKNSSETKKIDAGIHHHHHHGGGGCNGLPSEYSPFFHFISFKFLKIFFCKFFLLPFGQSTVTLKQNWNKQKKLFRMQ